MERILGEWQGIRRNFIDLRKDFDAVNHNILLKKLQGMGITGNLHNIIEDYLSGREQYTEVNGQVSSTKDITYGVPQGSILGPKLFKIFVNDLSERILDGELFMYADDTTGYFVHENVECVIESLSKMLQIINQWCIANKLTINTDKTEAMLITKRPFIGPLQRLTLGEKVIDLKESVKRLGVIIDKGLNWDKQIKEHCSKL